MIFFWQTSRYLSGPPSVPAFFVIANKMKDSVEVFQIRNNKKELHSGRAATRNFVPNLFFLNRK